MTTVSPPLLPEDKMAPTMAYLHSDVPPNMTLAEYRRANKRPSRRPLVNPRRKARIMHARLTFDELLREEMA